MRYLSQATVPVPSALHAGITDGYTWHKAIWDSFPGRPDADRDFLFRVDRRGEHVRILVLSADPPMPTGLLKWQTKEVADGFLAHDAYRFQLKANPTMRRSSDKRRLAIFDEDRLKAWIDRKAQVGGFSMESLVVGAPVAEVFVKHGKRGKHVAVEYEGVLRVVDRDAFVETFQNGIGAAKGFGFGLLMLQPIH